MREQLLQIQLHINAPLSGIEGEGCTRDHLILGTKLVTCTDGAKEVPKNRIPLNPLYPRISSYPVSRIPKPPHSSYKITPIRVCFNS